MNDTVRAILTKYQELDKLLAELLESGELDHADTNFIKSIRQNNNAFGTFTDGYYQFLERMLKVEEKK